MWGAPTAQSTVSFATLTAVARSQLGAAVGLHVGMGAEVYKVHCKKCAFVIKVIVKNVTKSQKNIAFFVVMGYTLGNVQ